MPAHVRWTAGTKSGALDLRHAPEANPNFRLDLASLHHYLQGLYQPIAIDLIRIAAHVYVADTSVSRGSDTDLWATGWNRAFSFTLPVLEPDRWNHPKVRNALVACLRFLTGDDYEFTFTKWTTAESQGYLALFQSPQELMQVNSICLISGGIDSLVAAVQSCERGEPPLLISHRSGIKLLHRRDDMINELRSRLEYPFPHWSVEITRVGKEAVERTQRSRAFLYASLGVGSALCLQLPKVYLADNGIASFHFLYSRLATGTEATRSTHPDFIASFNYLLQTLSTNPPVLANPLIYSTRAEAVRYLEDLNLQELIGLTSSCSRTHLATNVEPHCGTCSQCVDRRFAIEACGLAHFDTRYAVDIFSDPLEPGADSIIPEEYVRSAGDLASMSVDAFLREFPLPSNWDPACAIDAQLRAMWDLHRRHAQTVLDVLATKFSAFSQQLAKGSLPDGCLLRVIPSPRMGRVKAAAEAIANTLRNALPKAFNEAPRSEAEVQSAVWAILTGYQKRFQREHPTVRFLGKKFTADFSPQLEDVVIEVKYPTKTRRMTAIREEMASDLFAYQASGKAVLFVIYDYHRLVQDEAELRADLDRLEPLSMVAVIR